MRLVRLGLFAVFSLLAQQAFATANFSWTPATPRTGEAVQFTDLSSVGPIPKSAWFWQFGDGTSSTLQHPVKIYAFPGTYPVTFSIWYNNPDFPAPQTVTYYITVIPGEELEALFNVSVNPKAGQTVSFFDVSTGGPTSWFWQFGDGGTATTQHASHIYQSPGNYVVSLRVQRGDAFHFRIININVSSDGAPINADFVWTPTSPAVGKSVTFSDTSTGDIKSWNWSFGDGTSGFGRFPLKTFNSAGSFPVKLTVSDGGVETSTTKTIIVGTTEKKEPVTDFSWSPTIGVVGEPVYFYDKSTENPTSYLWTFGDGTTSTSKNPVKTFTFAAGAFQVKLTATNAEGASSRSYGIEVRPAGKPPEAGFTFTPANPVVAGVQVQFTDLSKEKPTSWVWNIGGTVVRGKVANVVFPAGTYPVTLTVENAFGKDSITGTVNVVPPAPALKADFSYSPLKVVQKKSVTFTDKSTGTPTGYKWLFGNGQTSTSASPAYTYDSPGTYNVTLHVTRGAESNALTRQVIVEPLPKPKANFVIAPTAPRANQPVSFTNTSTNEYDAAEWTIAYTRANGQRVTATDSNLVSTTRTFEVGGLASVTLKVSNAGGSDTLTRTVNVQPAEVQKPTITSILGNTGRCYFRDFNLIHEAAVYTDWKGTTPKDITWSVNAGSLSTTTAASPTILKIPTGNLRGSGNGTLINENTYSVTPINTLNTAGDPRSDSIYVFSKPAWMSYGYTKTLRESDRYSVIAGIALPPEPVEAKVNIPSFVPMIGGKQYGLKKTQWVYEYTLRTDCTAASQAKGETGFQFGTYIITGNITGGGETTITPSQGLVQKKGFLGLEIAGNAEQEVPLIAAFPVAASLCNVRGVKAVCDIAKVKLEIKIAGGGVLWFTNTEKEGLQWSDTNVVFGPEVKASLSIKYSDNAYLDFFGGGKFGFTVGYPQPEKALPMLRKFEVTVEGGAKARILLLVNAEKKFGATCSSEKLAPITCGASAVDDQLVDEDGRPILQLVPTPLEHELGTGEVRVGRFRARGEAVVAEKMFSLAAPSAARTGSKTVVAFMHENTGVTNLIQRSDLRSMTLADGQWSAPKSIVSDDTADFAPSIATRGDGRVVALWQRPKANNLTASDLTTTADLAKIYAQMEIMAAEYNADADSWSTPAALSSNDLFDYGARAVALADGSMLAVWLRDASNQMFGTSAAPIQVISRRWASGTWGPETVVAGNLTGVLALSLAANGSEAIVTYARDKDGDSATSSDTEIATARFSAGAWAAARDVTSDSTADNAPTAVYDPSGQARVAWMRDTNLVWQAADASGSPSMIRAIDGGAGHINRTFARSPNGQLVLLWVDRNGGTPDILAMTYDRQSSKWSEPVPFTRTSSLESSLSGFFADDATVTVVALDTAIADVASTVTIEGKQYAVQGVPQPGDSSLIHLEKTLRVDPQAIAGGLATLTEDPSAGAKVTLQASVVNAGDLTLRDVPWRLVRGASASGQTLASGIVSGDWLAGEAKLVDAEITYEAGLGQVTFLLDPDQTLSDFNAGNNVSTFSFINAPPVACVQLSRMIGVPSFEVTFDATCSSDADGLILSYTWTFPDGTSATGTSAKRTFTTVGAHQVTLSVMDNMGRRTSKTVEVFAGATTDLRIPGQVEALHVPIVGRTAGAGGSFFVSDASLLNPDAQNDLEVTAVYMPTGRTDFYTFSATVPPGQVLEMPDVVAGRLSAPAGTGWLRFDLSHPHAVVTTRSYNSQPTGTAGSAVPGLGASQAVTSGTRRIFLSEWKTGFRTNIGFAEIGGMENDITVIVYNEAGAEVGRKTYLIPAYGHMQVNSDPLLQRAGRIEVTSEPGTVLAYVATTDNQTGDLVFQPGVSSASLSGPMRMMVPVVARLRGAFDTVWRTDVRIWNASGSGQEVTINLHTAGGTVQKKVALTAGQTIAYDDIIGVLFPEVTGDTGGSLDISSGGQLAVASRTYNLSTTGTYGQAVPSSANGELGKEGDVLHIIGLRSDDVFRCNIGITAADAGALVRVVAYNSGGDLLGEKTYLVGARQAMQINRIFNDLGITRSLAGARLQIDMLGGSARVYASVVDNRTGDGTFIEASR